MGELCLVSVRIGTDRKWAQDAKISSANLITVASPPSRKRRRLPKMAFAFDYPAACQIDNGGTIAQSPEYQAAYPSVHANRQKTATRVHRFAVSCALRRSVRLWPDAPIWSFVLRSTRPPFSSCGFCMWGFAPISLALHGCSGLTPICYASAAWLSRYPATLSAGLES